MRRRSTARGLATRSAPGSATARLESTPIVQRPFHVRLSLALGGLDRASDSAYYLQELRVDRIRVWQ
jgi:hypothetical protein